MNNNEDMSWDGVVIGGVLGEAGVGVGGGVAMIKIHARNGQRTMLQSI